MKFITDDDRLTVKLQSWELVWGLKRKLVVPKDKIVSLEWFPDFTFEEKIWRTAGTGFPGVLYAGHFRGGGERYYLYLHEPHGIAWVSGVIQAHNTLVISTQDFTYKEILLSCDPEIGASLLNWWKQGRV